MRLEYIGPDRAEEISEIAYTIFFEVYPYETRDTILGFLDETQAPDKIREQMAVGMRYAFILADDGERAGYVGYGMDGDRMFLSKLYLFPEFRGHGLGSAVMDLAEREAVEGGARAIYLDVNGRNTDAIDLYHRKGYIEKGRTGLSYIRVVMEKPLPGRPGPAELRKFHLRSCPGLTQTCSSETAEAVFCAITPTILWGS